MSTTSTGGLRPFLLRLHFYIGLFIGPFIFVAALTGLLYILTPQIEDRIYADALHTNSSGPPRSLAEQAQAARDHLNDALNVSVVRPATEAGRTTRVMFSDPQLGPSENRTVFVDPLTLAIRGDMTTYGTSGVLPLRTTLDQLHRSLLLGDWGRYYSELAASWLWVVVLGGVALWATGPKRKRALRDMPPAQRRRWIHATTGMTAGIVMVFLSVTGLTWSQAAGARIDMLRATLGWQTPALSLEPAGSAAHAHHHHHAPDLTAREDRLDQLDAVLVAARTAGLGAAKLEIRLPKPGKAWMVAEYDRSWPTQVDTLALAPDTLDVLDRTNFESFGLIPKLIRWGIDAHMGVLFGVPNQILMALVAIGLMVTIAYGYAMWWARRPGKAQPLTAVWVQMSATARLIWILVALAAGWALPTLGLSLLGFILFDALRSRRRHVIT